MRCMPPSPVDTLETTVDGVLSRDSFCPSYAAGIIWKNCFRYLKRGKSRRLHPPVAQRFFGAGPWRIPSPAMSLGVGWRDAQGHALAVRSESAVTRSTEGDVVSLLRRPKWYKLSRKLRNDYIAKFSAAEVGDRVSPDPPDGHESGEATSTSDFSVGWSAGRSAP